MIFRRLMCIVVLALAGLAPASAQETVLGGDAAAAPPPAGWTTRCISDGRTAGAECTLTQRAVMQNSGQLVGSVTLRLPPQGGQATILVTAPLGMFIPAGVSFDIDGAGGGKLELQTCDRNGCYASAPLTADVITAMQKGQKLNINFQSLNKRAVQLPMSLVGFTAAYTKTK